MDALLTWSARQALEAVASRHAADQGGVLIGHKRGRRFIVEKAVVCLSDVFPDEAEYTRLKTLLKDEVVGFFFVRREPPLAQIIPPPFSVGKLVLSVRSGRKAGCVCRAFVVDYTDRFLWRPLKIVSGNEHRHA